MVRSLLRGVLLALLIAASLAPLAESFDTWDTTPGLTSDTEFNVAALALVAGLFATVALLAVQLCNSYTSQTHFRLPVSGKTFRGVTLLPFFPGCSPPGTPLRI
ncbi:MAG: hypothetical protein ABR990_08345 [Terracidiphilus sp.]|jgi:hypothetical protein